MFSRIFSARGVARHGLIKLMPACLVGSLLLLTVAGCSPVGQDTVGMTSAPRSVEELAVVDCLLPGQTIQQGRFQRWVSPPRPTKTTAGDCERQGGQYVISARARRDEALPIWQPAANTGDITAQTTVGEIYQKALGPPPDYSRAAEWYRKAAEQGSARAQVNLAFLYENGLGVPKDPAAAERLYRTAAGLPDEIKLTRGPSAELQTLQSENESLRRKLQEIEKSGQVSKQLAQEQQDTILKLKQQYQELADKLLKTASAKPVLPRNIDFGKYYALMIGNSKYYDQRFDQLVTPQNDVRRLEDILRKRYNFKVITVTNGTHDQIIDALFKLSNDLKESDNLLIYYSGHGELKEENQVGYWVPIDGKYGDVRKWFSNRELISYIDIIKARHVMIIADSCYAGTLAMSSIVTFDVNMSIEDRERLIRILTTKRSRSVLAAGGLNPVPEIRDGKYSMFAKALVEALEKNEGLMEGKQLHNLVAAQVLRASEGRTLPQYAYLNGHEAAEFFFVPVLSVQARRGVE